MQSMEQPEFCPKQDLHCKQLELNIISTQDLKKVKLFRTMHVYATTWIQPNIWLSTHMDTQGDTNPTWNVRLTFQVQELLLIQETTAIVIEIYSQGRFRDTILGTIRVLLSNLITRGYGYEGSQFIALQVRRPSGRPQEILNIGSMLLDF
eukprot:c4783_g1_i1 orf=23-472(+)